MKRVLFIILITGLCMASASAEDNVLTMSTTTSTQASGLLDILLPQFEKDTGIRVKVIAKGTGAAIKDGMDGNVDIIFVHARSREDLFVKEGYGTKRYAVMHNDFIILGSAKDKAGLKGMKDVAAAMKKLANSNSFFISRGDDSGTHTKEQFLWKSAGINLDKVTNTIIKSGAEKKVSFIQPAVMGKRYVSIGQGMGKTLTYTDEKQAYTLCDRGTYIKYKFGRDVPVDLEIIIEGDQRLSNPYGIILVNPKKYPHVKYNLAKTFSDWIVSEKGQSLIGGYKLLGKQLFYPDAIN